MRLLIVDDSALMRKVTHLAFPGKRYEIEEAGSGFGALAQLALAQRPFDVIVLDLQMPDMNGVEFIRAVRQRPLYRDTPIVIASSESEDSELMKEARRLGVAAVVRKPWKPQELAAAVQIAASRPGGGKEST